MTETDPVLIAALEIGLRALTPEARLLLSGLGAHVSAEFGHGLVALLGGAEEQIAELVAAGLAVLEREGRHKRWRLHPHVHAHARRWAAADPEQRAETEARIVDWYLRRSDPGRRDVDRAAAEFATALAVARASGRHQALAEVRAYLDQLGVLP